MCFGVHICVFHATIELLQDRLSRESPKEAAPRDVGITTVIGGRLNDLSIVTGSNLYSKRADHLVAGMAPGLASHNWHRLPHTSGANRGQKNYSHNCPKTRVLPHLAYELHDNLDSGSANWSALD